MDFLSTLAEFVIGLLGKKPVAEVKVQIPFDGPVAEEAPKSDLLPEVGVPPYIDWTNGSAMVSKHFTVKETCWLPSWKVMHIPSEIEKQNILKQAAKMDLIRDFLNVPINIHCWIRPILNNPESEHNGEDYNALVKGAKNSAHKIGLATDYDASGLNCDDVRSRLEGKLEEWQIRMEKMPGGNWVHNDCAPVIAYRYFNP
jgi:hypothetical protein